MISTSRTSFVPYEKIYRIDLAKLINDVKAKATQAPSIKKTIGIEEQMILKATVSDVFNHAHPFSQAFIIQDLLFLGKDLSTPLEQAMVSFAAELYVNSDKDLRKNFRSWIKPIEKLYGVLGIALLTNSIFHIALETEKVGSSGYSKAFLQQEETIAIDFSKADKED